jgi:Mn2+/Fe2+ NRAMP family transporter
MLGSAADNNWAVQSLTTPAPGAGPVLGGFATKTEDGIPVSLAVVGTNIGPYLVAALGASTVSEANAKKFALTVFKSLSATLS